MDISSQNTTKVKFLFSTGQITQEQLWETYTKPKNNTFSIEVKTLLTISLSLKLLCNVKAGLNISSWLWTSNPHVITPALLWLLTSSRLVSCIYPTTGIVGASHFPNGMAELSQPRSPAC